jgi:uncharacterized RDD family membrane protein YckC
MPIQENQNNAGYLIRLFASLLNGFIWWTVFLLLPLYLLSVNYLENKEAVIANMVFYALLFLFLISVGIYYVHIYMTSKYGGSPGKLLFGLKVLDNDTSEYLDTLFLLSSLE